VVAANLKAPAYVTPKAAVVPTSYQDEAPRPMPAGPAAAPTAPRPVESPRPMSPPVQPVAAPRPQPSAQPAKPMPQPQPVAQATAPKLRPGTPTVVAKAEPISPYANRQQPAARPATPATPEVRPASAYQPVEPSKPTPASQPIPAAQPVIQPAPRPMPVQDMPTSSPVGARPMPTERGTGRPTSPDITPSFMNYIKQRVSQVSGGKAREVELQKMGSDRLRIALMVNTPQEGEEIASKILGINELGPFQVDVEVRLAK
jgi:hypothetical protein